MSDSTATLAGLAACASSEVQAAVLRLSQERERFLAFLERRTGDRGVAEDILQQAFVISLERAGEIRDDSATVAWFYRVLRNAVTDRYRRVAAHERGLERLKGELESQVQGDELHRAVCRCVGELAKTLKPEHAYALQRVEVDGIAVHVLGDELGISANAAAARLFRARAALRRRVSECCAGCAKNGCLDCNCERCLS